MKKFRILPTENERIVLTLKSVANILAPLFKKRDVAAVAIPPNPPNTRHTCEFAKDCHYFFSNLCSSYSGDNYKWDYP